MEGTRAFANRVGSISDQSYPRPREDHVKEDDDFAHSAIPSGVCYTYAKILARFWYVICLLVFITVAAFGALTFTLYNLPDFGVPDKGFEARGTTISARYLSFNNLIMNEKGLLTNTPTGSSDTRRSRRSSIEGARQRVPQARAKRQTSAGDTGFRFCFIPYAAETVDSYFPILVFEGVDGGNILTVEGIKSMCQAEERRITSHPSHKDHCLCNIEGSCPCNIEGGCPSTWSIGNYVALLSNRTSCGEITEDDVAQTVNLLAQCTPYFKNVTRADIENNPSYSIPFECSQHDFAVFTILYYLLPSSFSQRVLENETPFSQIAAVILPLNTFDEDSRDWLETVYRNNIAGEERSDGITTLVAASFVLKHTLFSSSLLGDSLYLGIAGAVIFLIIWLYTGSSLVTLATLLNIIFSIILADFFFTAVFLRPFFPFGNILAVILLLGVGADDTFVYMDLWKKCKSEFGDEDLPRLVYETIRHAALTMFVTSVTTSTALYASVISDIIVVKCFAVFAGTAIVMNLVLTLTLLPAVLIMQHKLSKRYCSWNSTHQHSRWKYLSSVLVKPFRVFFNDIIPFLVAKLRHVWIAVFLALMAGSIFASFYMPGLKAPSTAEFQYFRDSHLFEQFDFVFKDQFKYAQESFNFRGSVVWGIEAVDNSDTWDPDSGGTLAFDADFRFSSRENQMWMTEFCKDLRNQTFYEPQQNHGCFIDKFVAFMQQPYCPPSEDLPGCCNHTTSTFEPSLFTACLDQFVSIQAQSIGDTGLYFLKNDSKLAVIRIDFVTNFKNTRKYADTEQIWTTVNTWVEDKMKTAPPSLQKGWFGTIHVFTVGLFDLQQSLLFGTTKSMYVTLGIATGILLLSIRNLLLTLFAMLTISSAVLVTVASLVLLGWELNVVEAAIITLAVGLSIDFTIHYAVAYKLAPNKNRRERTQYSLKIMAPAISMAAFSTFTAGALVLPATVLSYNQFGIFLMLVMSISWVHATFFFQSLCMVMGPQGSCGELPCRCCDCGKLATKPQSNRRNLQAYDNHGRASSTTHDSEEIRTVTNGRVTAPVHDAFAHSGVQPHK